MRVAESIFLEFDRYNNCMVNLEYIVSGVRHYAQSIVAICCISGTLAFCAFAIVDYESDQCHYREVRGFNDLLGKSGWCRIL